MQATMLAHGRSCSACASLGFRSYSAYIRLILLMFPACLSPRITSEIPKHRGVSTVPVTEFESAILSVIQLESHPSMCRAGVA